MNPRLFVLILALNVEPLIQWGEKNTYDSKEKLTNEHFIAMWGCLLLASLLAFLGFLPLGQGGILTLPVNY